MNISLEALRARVASALIGLALLHVPLLALSLWGHGQASVFSLTLLAAAALVLPLLYNLAGPALVTQLAIAAVLIGQVSTLVFSFAGHPWQADMHMYYFAVLALLAGFCDWRPIVLGAALTAAHHLTLQYVLPTAVFYQGGDLLRVLIHAVIVVIETTFLAAFAVVLQRRILQSEASVARFAEAAGIERRAYDKEREIAVALQHRSEALRSVVAAFRREMDDAMALLDHSSEAMNAKAEALTRTSYQVQSQTSRVFEAASGTMGSIDHLSAASMEMVASISEIGRNAGHSAKGAKAAADLARNAGDEIENLARRSENIGAVVEIIRSIAAQTSMLALNATIEAARAGEMGRGFAVVASEVKTLSAQTAQATDEVSGQVGAIQQATQRCLKAMREIAGAIQEVEALADAIACSVNEQERATSEIAHQVRLSFEGAQRSADIAGSFEAMTIETHGAATQLGETAAALSRQAQTIRRGVAGFCGEVAAA